METATPAALPPPIPQRGGPPPIPPERLSFFPRVIGKISLFCDYLFGLITILLVLAALSAIPILHFFSLGYLLESSARIARSGRIRDGLIGLPVAARIGKILVAAWLIFLPIRLLYSYWVDANIIDSGSEVAKNLAGATIIVITLASFGLFWAIIRGGRFRNFIWPAPIKLIQWMGRPKSWQFLHDIVTQFKQSAALLGLFKLGVFGFIGGVLWLFIPVGILFLASYVPNQILSLLTSLFGGILLAIVVLHLPFIQTRYAMTGNFSEFKNWREARSCFRRAPLALWIALFVTLLFALPLYLLKIQLAPREVAWIPNLFFVVFMFPARILLGWAMSRSFRRQSISHWFFRWFGRVALVPAVGVYVFIVWLTQYMSWHGTYSLFEQHAFLLPAPMLGL